MSEENYDREKQFIGYVVDELNALMGLLQQRLDSAVDKGDQKVAQFVALGLAVRFAEDMMSKSQVVSVAALVSNFYAQWQNMSPEVSP